jgi:hypothetical protein
MLPEIDLPKQLEKCKVCPCMKDGEMRGCIHCDHYKKECAPSDCGGEIVSRVNNSALCSAIDCLLTQITRDRMENELCPLIEVTCDLKTNEICIGPPTGDHILCMPLVKNIPQGHDDWKEVDCPNCGQACWDRPVPTGFETMPKMCTQCSLQETVKKIRRD